MSKRPVAWLVLFFVLLAYFYRVRHFAAKIEKNTLKSKKIVEKVLEVGGNLCFLWRFPPISSTFSGISLCIPIPHGGMAVFLKNAKYVGFFNVCEHLSGFMFQKKVVILQPKNERR